MNLDLDKIADFKISDVPPWIFSQPRVLYSLHNDKKSQLLFELNIMSSCLTFQTMRLYLQMVQRMTQLDQPVLLSLLKCR